MKFEPKKYKISKVTILGPGRSAVACAKLLAEKGFKVLISERSSNEDFLKEKIKIKAGMMPIFVETGGHTKRIFDGNFAVKSPGIATNAPVIKKLKKAKIPIFSELEIALSYCPKAKLFAVTGTNGKTTVTAMLCEILKIQYGKDKVVTAGNIGIALSGVIDKVKPSGKAAIEISSYQLEDSKFFKPHIACVLNITPDHTDHHGSMAKYIKAKEKIFASQTKKDFCIFNADDKTVVKLSKKAKSKKLFFSTKSDKYNACLKNGKIILKFKNKIYKLTPPNLPGSHNAENAMAAGLMAMAANVKEDAIEKAFKKFKGVAHRMENVGVLKGIRFINDSKATNVNSTLTALKALDTDKKIWLIMGGLDKGSSYKVLAPLLKKKVKCIFTVGDASNKIVRQLKGICPIKKAVTIQNAIKYCLKRARRKDICLLSPSCASFDQFKNFEERGKAFKKTIAYYKKLS